MSLIKDPRLLFCLAYRRYMLSKPLAFSKQQHLLVACMPKSGSTYLATILSGMPGMRVAHLVPGYGRREQELDIGMLRAAHSMSYVAQHHVRYSAPTGILLDRFSIKSIVLVRNIFDIVISIRDHFRSESVEGSAGYILPEMVHWDNLELERFVVTMCLPWYFNFYMSWLDCKDKVLIRYEDLIRSPESAVTTIYENFNLKYDSKFIDRAVQIATDSNTRKNKGVAGRGLNLDANSKDKIYEMASFYKNADFSPIGL